MMSKLKTDLEKELDLAGEEDKGLLRIAKGASSNGASKKFLNKEEQIKMQIKHLDEQMKGVVFLLMQCQIGLEMINDTSKNNVNSHSTNGVSQADNNNPIVTTNAENNTNDQPGDFRYRDFESNSTVQVIEHQAPTIQIPKINVEEIESN